MGGEGSGRYRLHDREKIAEELIEWAKQPESTNLCKFCCTREPPMNPRKMSEWADEDDFFKEAYETAKAFIGGRREELLSKGKLHVKAYDLNATTYDYFLKEEKKIQGEIAEDIRARSLKGDARVAEEERQKVMDSIQRNKNPIRNDNNHV